MASPYHVTSKPPTTFYKSFMPTASRMTPDQVSHHPKGCGLVVVGLEQLLVNGSWQFEGFSGRRNGNALFEESRSITARVGIR
jgi:hypothetical protein